MTVLNSKNASFPENLLMAASAWLNEEGLNKETKYKEIN